MLKLFKKKPLPPYEYVIEGKMVKIARYTRQLWIETGHIPDAYEQENIPTDTMAFVCKVLDDFDDFDVNQYMVCTIDDEMKQWSIDNRKPLDTKTVAEYITQMNEEDAYRLLEKHNEHEAYAMCIIPYLYYSINLQEQDFPALDKTERKMLTEYLEQIYGDGNVFVPGFMLGFDKLRRDDIYIAMENVMTQYFQNKANVNYGMLSGTANYIPGIAFYMLGIPFGVRIKYDSAVFPDMRELEEKDIIRYLPDNLIFEREFLDEIEKTDVKEFEKTEFYKKMEQHGCDNVLFTYPVAMEEVETFYGKFQIEMAKQAAEQENARK